MRSETSPLEAPPQQTYARFSDGTSARAHDAAAALGISGVEIQMRNPEKQLIWPYASLKAAEPIRTHAIDVLLASSSTPGASLFVPGPEFARNLRLHAPHLTAKAERWRHARPWVFAMAAVIGLGEDRLWRGLGEGIGGR